MPTNLEKVVFPDPTRGVSILSRAIKHLSKDVGDDRPNSAIALLGTLRDDLQAEHDALSLLAARTLQYRTLGKVIWKIQQAGEPCKKCNGKGLIAMDDSTFKALDDPTYDPVRICYPCLGSGMEESGDRLIEYPVTIGLLMTSEAKLKYVIRRRNDGAFVTPPGSEHSYTTSIRQARLFDSRESAEGQRCENETVASLEELLKDW